MWIDTYPDDFHDPPSYLCLAKLEKFARQHVPESDLGIRLKHKIDKFKREDNNKSGKIYSISDYFSILMKLIMKMI